MKWEHDSIEKYVVVMGKIINNISVAIENEALGQNEDLKVPVTYGPREKILAAAERKTVDDDEAPKVAITFPRIAFEISGPPVYDGARMSPATIKRRLGEHSYTYNPPAYNIGFTVSIIAKSSRVANRIMERIVPSFRPALSVTVKPFPVDYPEYKRDVIIELQSVVPNNTYLGDFMERQYIGWDLTFVFKGWLFGPIIDSARITKVDVNFVDNTIAEAEDLLESAYITPGLTSGGEPTSNSSLTIPRNSIEPTDNYGYITEYFSEGE